MTTRRYLTFSLRTAFVLFTAFAVWLGVIVHRARGQREAVKAIEALGGNVLYDWQVKYSQSEKYGISFSIDRSDPPGPGLLRRFVGDEFFQDVEVVFVGEPEANALNAIPHVRQFRALRILVTFPGVSAGARAKFEASLPGCEIW